MIPFRNKNLVKMEYYLRCQNCQHLNPVQSEFLTFCEQCKKKLPNNYREWSKLNDSGSFDEYKKQVCELREDKTPEPQHEKARGHGLKHWVNMSITLAVIIGLWPFYLPVLLVDSDIMFFMNQISKVSGVSGMNWHTEDFESFGMKLESPVQLQHTNFQIPPQQLELVERMEAYSSSQIAELGVVVVNNEFKEGVAGVNMQAMATSSVMQMKSMPGASDFDISQKEIQVDGVDGFRQDGTFSQYGRTRGFAAIGLTRGQMLWQVIVIFPIEREDLKDAAERIMESIEIYYGTSV